MACRYICDGCHADVPPEGGYEPYGWFTLSQRYTLNATRLIEHSKCFCSLSCVITFVAKLQVTAAPLGISVVNESSSVFRAEPDPSVRA